MILFVTAGSASVDLGVRSHDADQVGKELGYNFKDNLLVSELEDSLIEFLHVLLLLHHEFLFLSHILLNLFI